MSKKRIAVFPGSFDPFTKGHEAIVLKATPLFDEIIIAIGSNTAKKNHFSIEERTQQIKAVFQNFNNINVQKELTENGIDIDKKSIIISGNNIKQLGKYSAKIRLHREVIFDLPFEVVADKK